MQPHRTALREYATPLSLPSVQAAPSAPFHWMMLALMFLPNRPATLLLVPYGMTAVVDVDAFAHSDLSRHPVYATLKGPQLHRFLLENKVGAWAHPQSAV